MSADIAWFEAELARRDAEVRELHRLARLGSWRWSIPDDHVEWSEVMYELAGWQPGTPIDFQRYATLLHPEDRVVVQETIRRALEQGTPYVVEHRIVRADGQVRWLRGSGDVVRDADGNITGLIGTAQDVTDAFERRAAEAESVRLRFLADASEELASSLDYEATLRNVARLAIPAIADWCTVDMLTEAGTLERLALHHDDASRIAMVWEMARTYPDDPNSPHGAHAVVRTGSSEYMREIPDELLVGTAQDERHLELLRGLQLRSFITAPLSARGRILGAITVVYAESGRLYERADVALVEDLARRAAVAIDNARLVHSLEQAQEQLEQQATELELQAAEMQAQAEELLERSEDLEQANRAKSDFLAVMSHELRTPLNAMIGYSELLLDGIPAALPAPTRLSVERIALSARHLLELIEDILTFARLEAGREVVDITNVELNRIIDEVCAIAEPLAVTRQLGFRCECPAGVLVRADARKLRQILLNLVGNAIKFTDEGRVEIVVSRRGEHVVVRITDTGIGIAAENLPHIFEPFYQVERRHSRRSQGTGLGLSVSRRFAELIGAELQVESVVGGGSRFTLLLTAAQAATPSPGAAAT